MATAIRYPLVIFYDPASAQCRETIRSLRELETGQRLQFAEFDVPGSIRARDASGRWFTGIGAVEAAYRAAWD